MATSKPSFLILGRKGTAYTPKCPACQAPLWLAACKCGWQKGKS
jgi:hypothetical protein